MGDEYNEEQLGKLRKFAEAIDDLEGIPIVYGIIIRQLEPLRKWLKKVVE